MTQEDYEYLLQYEHTFYTAKIQSYARILPRTVNEKLHAILNDKANRNLGCSSCVLGMYRRLYDVLKEEKKKRVEKKPEPIETETVEKPKTKKSATNKKIRKEE